MRRKSCLADSLALGVGGFPRPSFVFSLPLRSFFSMNNLLAPLLLPNCLIYLRPSKVERIGRGPRAHYRIKFKEGGGTFLAALSTLLSFICTNPTNHSSFGGDIRFLKVMVFCLSIFPYSLSLTFASIQLGDEEDLRGRASNGCSAKKSISS